MDSYDKNKIGKLISWGSEHFVYAYEADKVIKFSIVDFLLGPKKGLARALSDYQICQNFFEPHLLKTQTVTSSNGKYVAKIQPKLEKRYLVIGDLKNKIISEQFKKIITAYNSLLGAGYPEVDLIGQPGVFKKCMSNIFVTAENKLAIIDTSILKIKDSFWMAGWVSFLRAIAIPVQNRRIKEFMAQIKD